MSLLLSAPAAGVEPPLATIVRNGTDGGVYATQTPASITNWSVNPASTSILVGFTQFSTSGQTFTVTVNGVPMTFLGSAVNTGSGQTQYAFGLVNPATGPVTVVVTPNTGDNNFAAWQANYSGVLSILNEMPNISSGAENSITTTQTISGSASWAVCSLSASNMGDTAGTGITFFQRETVFGAGAYGDSAGPVAPGPFSSTITAVGQSPQIIAGVYFELVPMPLALRRKVRAWR